MSTALGAGTPLIIRDARAADAAPIARWMIAMAWETEHKALDPDIVARGVYAVFEQPARGRYFIAERNVDGAVVSVGVLMLTHEWSDWRDGDWWWIQSVYVQPASRRSGVYRALYGHVHALAQATPDVCGLRLYVERDNANAQRTYAALGMGDAGYAIFEEEFARENAEPAS
ncbi:MAG TPA: GNAT family N-acetyltransferase [Xanthomonadaceae bacterium]|nr:GNAT family N-acetyltransferase [Xanthomonadaceae bacterium]